MPEGQICCVCNVQAASYRCADCHGMPFTCLHCTRDIHLRNPLHRIEQWTGKYFSPSWLWKVGISINLGHRGEACPSNCNGDFNYQSFTDTQDYLDEEEELEDYGWVHQARPPPTQIVGARIMVVVHTNGIHYLPVRFCHCLNSPSEDVQMIQLGYYPSTYKTIQTMFTFQLLDDYLLENLECQTSAHHYYQKLRRMTNKVSPHLVPVSSILFSDSTTWIN